MARPFDISEYHFSSSVTAGSSSHTIQRRRTRHNLQLQSRRQAFESVARAGWHGPRLFQDGKPQPAPPPLTPDTVLGVWHCTSLPYHCVCGAEIIYGALADTPHLGGCAARRRALENFPVGSSRRRMRKILGTAWQIKDPRARGAGDLSLSPSPRAVAHGSYVLAEHPRSLVFLRVRCGSDYPIGKPTA